MEAALLLIEIKMRAEKIVQQNEAIERHLLISDERLLRLEERLNAIDAKISGLERAGRKTET